LPIEVLVKETIGFIGKSQTQADIDDIDTNMEPGCSNDPGCDQKSQTAAALVQN
jgi:hypothetical protein